MALDSVRLKDNIINRMFAGITLSPADQAKIDDAWVIISEEIIAEIKRAVVSDVNASVFTPGVGGLPDTATGDIAKQTGLTIS